jgi:hypothetical protein
MSMPVLSRPPARAHPVRPMPAPTVPTPTALRAEGMPARLRLHPSVSSLFRHLDKHVLDVDARPALRAAFPCIAEVEDLATEKATIRWQRRPDRNVSDDAVVGYVRMIEQSITEACTLGFFRTGRQTAVTLDSAGLLVVVDHGTVVTAFIPGVDFRGKTRSGDDDRSRHEIARNDRRRAERNGDERYYYEVFRPAIQQIRRFPVEDTIGGIEYGALKLVLPRSRHLDLVSWIAMRRGLDHGPMEFES